MNHKRVKPTRLHVVMPNWLGDFIMALPALKAVRRDNPLMTLRLWAPRKLASLGNLIPWAGPITAHDGMHSAGAWMGFTQWLRQDGGEGATLIFVNNFRTALLSRMAGSTVRMGLSSEGRGWLLTHPVKLTDELRRAHRSRWYEAIAAPLIDTPLDPLCRTLEAPREGNIHVLQALSKTAGSGAFKSGADRVVALAVGAAYGPAKEYGVERFREVARLLVARGLRPMVVGSASEWELGSKITADIPGSENMAGATSLEGLAALLASCSGFIGNDSGPMHLAAALGVPTVGIFGSTDPSWTGPVGPRARFLAVPPSCAPCFQKTCPKPPSEHMQCMRAIAPTAVVGALESLLNLS